MEPALRDQIVAHVRTYLDGGESAAALEAWLLPATWNIHKHPDAATRELAGSAMLYLAEYDRGHRTEAELRSLLDTQPTGTRAGNVMRLSGPTFEISLRSSNVAELQKVLADQQPAIVFLKTGPLEYWSMDIFHTAVLIGLDATTAALKRIAVAAPPIAARRQVVLPARAGTGAKSAGKLIVTSFL